MKFLILNFISLSILFFLYLFRKNICLKLKLIDKPGKISIHKDHALLFGGIFLISGLILNLLTIYYYELNVSRYLSFSLIISFFLIALIDDIKNLNPNLRLFLALSACLISFYLEPELKIYSLNFAFNNFVYINNNIFFGYIFSVLCILLLVNAFNFIDGIDGLATSIGLSFFLYIILKNFHILDHYYLFLISLIFFLFLNIKYNIFLGDAGNYLISISIATLLIKENYYNPTLYFAEEIFLLFLIPGIDMLRLFINRIIKKQNPFKGDNNHFHHKLLKKFGNIKSVLIYLSIVNLPIYIYFFSNSFLILLIFISIFVYFILLRYTS